MCQSGERQPGLQIQHGRWEPEGRGEGISGDGAAPHVPDQQSQVRQFGTLPSYPPSDIPRYFQQVLRTFEQEWYVS